MGFLTHTRKAARTGVALFCLIALAMFVLSGCSKDKGTGPDDGGGGGGDDDRVTQSASLGACGVDIDKINDIITLKHLSPPF